MKQAIILQRLEGLVLFMMSLLLCLFFIRFGENRDHLFLIYLLLFFTFDISMVGYLHSPKLGATIYNLGHSLTIPLIGFIFGANPYVYVFSLIWIGHIGFDRMLGYGLKSTAGFKHTHLGDIGKQEKRPE